MPQQDPWTVTSPSAGVYRFTNQTGKPAGMIYFRPRGVDLDTGDPGSNGVAQRIEPGRHFDIKMKRKPGAPDPAAVEMEWKSRREDGEVELNVWRYAISE